MSESNSQAIANNLKNVFKYLVTQNPSLHSLHVTYEGSGDSGQIENVVFYKLDKNSYSGDSEIDIETNYSIDKSKLGCSEIEDKYEYFTNDDGSCHIYRLLDCLAWDLAYDQNPGFEINEGGFGSVIIEFDTDLLSTSEEIENREIIVKVCHSDRIIETRDSTFTF
jgi:hypothetical protein